MQTNQTKRGRRFERRLSERRKQTFWKDMREHGSLYEALHELIQVAGNGEWARRSAAFDIRSLMQDMMAMKECVNSRDVVRWYARLEYVLLYLGGGNADGQD